MTGDRVLDAALLLTALGATPMLLIAAVAAVCARRGVTE